VPSVEADPTNDGSLVALREGRVSFASDKRRVIALAFVAVVLTATAAVVIWGFVSRPLLTATDWGGTGRESVIVGIRAENSGRFDLRVTGVVAEGSTSARLRSVGIRSSPTAPRVEPFVPFTLKAGERTYVVLTYSVLCDQVAPSRTSLGGIDIRYEVFGLGRTKHIANRPPELSPAQLCR
jgi:hypothetical protein